MSVTSKKILRKLLVACIALFATAFVTTLGINFYIIYSTKDCIFYQIADLPEREFELVLGTEPIRSDGSINLHFLNRTEAAARLFVAGKVKYVLVSGNKNNRGFNEALEMKRQILTKGVPEKVINLDFDGSRTWESIRKAKDTYDLDKIIVITDPFHAPCAIFLCKYFGIEATAFCYGQDPFGSWWFRYNFREYFARVKAACDILIHKART